MMCRSMFCIKKTTQVLVALRALVQSTKEKILGLGDGGGKMPSTKSAASTQKINHDKQHNFYVIGQFIRLDKKICLLQNRILPLNKY